MPKERKIIQLCIAAIILLLPLAQIKVIFFGVPLYSVEIPILGALLAYLYGWWRGIFFPFKETSFHNPLVIGIGLFLLGAISSFVANPFSLTGLGMLKTWFISPLLMVWLIFQLQLSEQEKNLFLNTWFVTILLVACGALTYKFMNGLTYDGRLAAWFLSPNYLAIFIAPGILMALQKLQKALEKKEHKKYLFQIFSLHLLFFVLYFTRSYGTWLAVFGAGLLMVFLSAQDSVKKNLWKILGAVIIISGLFFFFEQGNSKWQSLISFESRSSLVSRTMIWQSATKIISDNPILGIGMGRFQEVYLEYQKYYPPYLEWAVPQPHNIILAVWLQTGLIGLVGFVLIIARSIYVLIQNKNQEAILLLGLLILYLVYGLFDTPFFKTDLALVFWTVMAFVFTLPKLEAEL